MRQSLRSWAILVAFVLAFCTISFGQTLGDISGEVHDQQGAGIAAATVTLTNQATGATRSTVSNDSGSYAFPALQPGTYTVKTEKTGFKGSIEKDIEVQVQANVRKDISLTIGAVSETIEVSASAPSLQTENASSSRMAPPGIAVAGHRRTIHIAKMAGPISATYR